jgi:tetratricopeptide (TPR) repeat protein
MPSYIAMNRIVEEQLESNSALRFLPRSVKKRKRPLLRDGRDLSDEELIGKLRAKGIAMDRHRLERESQIFLSAEELSRSLTEARTTGSTEDDWIWISLTVLWERWLPARPSLEMLDDKMQEGYRWVEEQKTGQAADLWLQAWRDFLALAERGHVQTIEAFDERFRGTQSVLNWVEDLEMELGNAGHDDQKFHHERIAFCREFLQLFAAEDRLVRENMRRAIGESLIELGETEEGDALFEEWLGEDPAWGWGWIGWSDNYWLFGPKTYRDHAKAEKILKRGLFVDNVRDRGDMLQRLADFYVETGQKEKADDTRRQLESLSSGSAKSDRPRASSSPTLERVNSEPNPGALPPRPQASESQALSTTKKTGRNDPCPCGSGKKFKKCCGR